MRSAHPGACAQDGSRYLRRIFAAILPHAFAAFCPAALALATSRARIACLARLDGR
jgi:hypothetical protein